MVSKSTFSLALFLLLTLLFFAFSTACGTCPSPKPKPKPNPKPPCPSSPSAPSVPSGPAVPSAPSVPSGPAVPSAQVSCPRDALKLGVCADLLGGLINISIGTPPVTPCCSLIQGLADLEAAVCLCTAIKANILGINLNIPLSLSLLLNVCSINPPPGFQCA